jgi:DNA-binding response OmpR family regulator
MQQAVRARCDGVPIDLEFGRQMMKVRRPVFAKSAAFSPPTAPTAIVFEKQPRWAPELQRQLSGDEARVVACRSLKDVDERCAGVSCGVVLLDAAVATTECLEFLRRGMADPKALPVVIVGSKPIADLEWAFREVGAAAFFVDRIPGHEMASVCRKLWSGSNHRSQKSSHR